jgi:hypothetical protein
VQVPRGPPRRTTTYNFEVANTHTYFVGGQATWVHNACIPQAIRSGIARAIMATGKKLNEGYGIVAGTTRFRCVECADAGVSYLQQHNVRKIMESLGAQAQRLTLTGIQGHTNAADLGGAVGRDIVADPEGIHRVIKITLNGESYIFDNVHPKGISQPLWEDGIILWDNNVAPIIVGRMTIWK